MRHSRLYHRIRGEIDHFPVIDCHGHITAPAALRRPAEPIAYLLTGYLVCDIQSAGATDKVISQLRDPAIPTEEKWPAFTNLLKSCPHTAYARIVRTMLSQVLGSDEITLANSKALGERLAGLDPQASMDSLSEAGIKALVVDLLWDMEGREMKAFMAGENPSPKAWKLVFPLPPYHQVEGYGWVAKLGESVDKTITSLGDYLEVVYGLLKQGRQQGMMGIKDQSAYDRPLDYEVVPTCEAERLFNRLLPNPRASLGWPERKPLDD